MRLLTRADWGARPPRSRRTMMLPKADLYLHHTAGSEPDGPAGVRAVQAFHMDRRGYHDIAYSFVVDRIGAVFEGRGAGVVGAHTKGHNTTSHAICVLGHYDRETPSEAALDGVAGLVAHGRRQGWWPAGITGGHRDVGSTSCPGNRLYAAIPDLNRRAATPNTKGPTVPTGRIAGGDRYETGVAAAQTGYPYEKHQGAIVFLIRADDWTPDPVAAVNLHSSPVLPVPREGTLPPSVAEALRRYRPSKVLALGGTGAVSESMLEQAGRAAAS